MCTSIPRLFVALSIFAERVRARVLRQVCTMACHHWFSHQKATRDFGYKPVVSLDEGLQYTIEYFNSAVKRRNSRFLDD